MKFEKEKNQNEERAATHKKPMAFNTKAEKKTIIKCVVCAKKVVRRVPNQKICDSDICRKKHHWNCKKKNNEQRNRIRKFLEAYRKANAT
jgi:hypothetical protein